MELTDIQKGYIAGMLDGEGSIHISRYKPPRYSYTIRVQISNTNLEALELIQSWVGGRIQASNRKTKPVYHLIFSSKESILDLLIPVSQHLVIKFDQALLMIDFCLMPGVGDTDTKEERTRIIERLKKLNKRGA